MDTSFNQQNHEQTERLKALDRLSDDDLDRPVGEHWTVGVALAHLAYYDGRVLGTLEASLRHGIPRLWWGSDTLASHKLCKRPVERPGYAQRGECAVGARSLVVSPIESGARSRGLG